MLSITFQEKKLLQSWSGRLHINTDNYINIEPSNIVLYNIKKWTVTNPNIQYTIKYDKKKY